MAHSLAGQQVETAFDRASRSSPADDRLYGGDGAIGLVSME